MIRIRFVTAIAVGSVVTEGLWDESPVDAVSTPPICFEWVVLESFVRKAKETGALAATGVPGSAKATAVISQGRRLGATNYLKTPSVFGFNGVYQPLARGLRVVGDDRMAAERAAPLVETWEAEQGLNGFLDRRPGSEGGGFRDRLTAAVQGALRAGHCAASPTGHLWAQLARSLPPIQAGLRERALLRAWLLDPEQPIREELARSLAGRQPGSEASLLDDTAAHASAPLRQRIEAVVAYERLCGRLDAVFMTLRHISTLQGTQPLTPADAAANPVIQQAARELPGAYTRMAGALEPLELLLPVESNLGLFGDHYKPGELVERILAHHQRVQREKEKREWFEEYGQGVVVRPMYRHGDPVAIDDSTFLHPFRVAALWQFMDDTSK